MLAGEGADDFEHGLPEEPLLSENAKDAWEKRQAEEKGGTANVRPIDGDPDGRLFGDDEERWRNSATTRSVCWVWTRVDSWLVPVRPAACPGRCPDGSVTRRSSVTVCMSIPTAASPPVRRARHGDLRQFSRRRADEIRSHARGCDSRGLFASPRSDLQANHQVALIALRPDGHWSSGGLRWFSDGLQRWERSSHDWPGLRPVAGYVRRARIGLSGIQLIQFPPRV